MIRIRNTERRKLTRELFHNLPEGCYIESNVPGYADEVGPLSQRQCQWKSVPEEVRYRLCNIYVSKAQREEFFRRWKAPLPTELSPTEIPSLTRKLLFSLPSGAYVVSDIVGAYSAEIAPASEREQQWRSVPKGARSRPCSVYNNEATYKGAMRRFAQLLNLPLNIAAPTAGPETH